VNPTDRLLARAARAALLAAACATAIGSTCPAGQQPPVKPSEKEARTAAQQKIDSQILQEIYRKRGQAAEKSVPPEPTLVRIDARGRALIDIRAKVTTDLVSRVEKRGGVIVSTDAKYDSIIARVPLLEIERLASDPAIRSIVPAAEATTVRHP
jgi:hypothetical protein